MSSPSLENSLPPRLGNAHGSFLGALAAAAEGYGPHPPFPRRAPRLLPPDRFHGPRPLAAPRRRVGSRGVELAAEGSARPRHLGPASDRRPARLGFRPARENRVPLRPSVALAFGV